MQTLVLIVVHYFVMIHHIVLGLYSFPKTLPEYLVIQCISMFTDIAKLILITTVPILYYTSYTIYNMMNHGQRQ